MKVYTKQLNYNLDKALIEKQLPSSIINHCASYHNKSQYYQSLFTWYTLYNIFLEEYNLQLNDFNLSFANSKPALLNSKYKFNISHSHEAIAIIISDKECGIDIQKEFIKPLIAKKVLNYKEKIE